MMNTARFTGRFAAQLKVQGWLAGRKDLLQKRLQNRRQLRPYSWYGSRFSLVGGDGEWLPFLRNAARQGQLYELNEAMLKRLRDPGAQLTHS